MQNQNYNHNQSARAFAYLCPVCGEPARGSRDAFTLLASDNEIPCSCGKSALRIQFDGAFFHVQVPCGLCGQIHTASCSQDQILRGSAAFNCPRTGNFCCFAGQEEKIEKYLPELETAKNARNQDQYQNQYQTRNPDSNNPDASPFLNDIIMYEILSELRDIAARPGGVSCQCGSEKYQMRVRRSSVDLICQNCGGRLRLPAATDQDLDDLCCHMRLVIPGIARRS